ncbi:MAG: hypothetical protein QNJ70_32140 [Xenococcaceae cyanobacterium MO_207.B15]|nr:hypothetical protein [Xenococcaceae cyanobacterium MO_207.B15]
MNGIIVGIAGIDSFALYDDGDDNTLGESDFALITDFDPRFDVIQLAGQVEQYRLEFEDNGEVSDAHLLYQPSSDVSSELIAVLLSVSSSLSLNTSAFTFVPSVNIFDTVN